MDRNPQNLRKNFVSTRWSLVAAAGHQSEEVRQEARASLCGTYWYPLYLFARRRGFSVQEAEDLTQGFFTRFLEKNVANDADRSRGRFRTFMLAAFKHFISNERDRELAHKRGGKCRFIELDFSDANQKYIADANNLSPGRAFDQAWALTVIDCIVAQLKNEYGKAGSDALFAELKRYLPGARSESTYKQSAELLGTTEAAVKMAVHRMRRRYRQVLRDRIADTLIDEKNVDEEIRYLMEALHG